MKLLTFDDFPKGIADALKRADAWQRLNESEKALYIFSRNMDAPLNNREKIQISEYLVTQKHLYKKVSFREEPGVGR